MPVSPSNDCVATPARKHDHGRVDEPDHLQQVRFVTLDLFVRRLAKGLISLAGRHAIDGVGDEHVYFGVEAGGLQNLIEELAGAADERLAQPVFLGPRCLADDHQSRFRVAPIDNHRRAGAGQGIVGQLHHLGEQLFEAIVAARGLFKEAELHLFLLEKRKWPPCYQDGHDCNRKCLDRPRGSEPLPGPASRGTGAAFPPADGPAPACRRPAGSARPARGANCRSRSGR